MIQHRPWPAAILGTVVLLILAMPVLGLRLGFSDESNFAEDTTTKQAYDLLVDGFGAGFAGPMLLVAELPEGTGPRRARAHHRGRARPTPAWCSCRPRSPTTRGTPPRCCGTSCPPPGRRTRSRPHTVNRLRNDVLPPAEQAAGVEVAVTGSTAANIDFSEYLAERLPYFFGPCSRCRSCC